MRRRRLLDFLEQQRFEAPKLMEKLFHHERAPQAGHRFGRFGGRHPLFDEPEFRIDDGLGLGDRGSEVVVRTRVRDAAAEHVPVFVENDRLRRGRAEVDADDAAHGVFPARRASIIWK